VKHPEVGHTNIAISHGVVHREAGPKGMVMKACCFIFLPKWDAINTSREVTDEEVCSSFITTTHDLTHRRQSQRTAGKCSGTHHAVRTWPTQTATKDRVRGQQLENDDSIQEAVSNWLRGAGMDFCGSGIFTFVQR
jgi:hypothetical protein